MTHGICGNAACPNGINRTPIERYAGPGEYCPECGEPLAPVAAPVAVPAAGSSVPFGGLTPLQALQQFDAEQPAAPVKRPRARIKRFGFAGVPVVLAAVAAVVLLGPGATGQTRSGDEIRVCRSSMTDRLASAIVRAYAFGSATPASRFTQSQGGACDVTFTTSPNASSAETIGRDAIVAVVNPQNAVVRLSQDQLRAIFTGDITDWAQVGGAPGPLAAVMPDTASDEARMLDKTLFRGLKIGAAVLRVASSADVVRTVVSGTGRGTVGLVAFSAAVPAKVIRLAGEPAPSPISIADASYPLSVAIGVEKSGASAGPQAGALVKYARSDDAQTLVSRDGLVPKKGF